MNFEGVFSRTLFERTGANGVREVELQVREMWGEGVTDGFQIRQHPKPMACRCAVPKDLAILRRMNDGGYNFSQCLDFDENTVYKGRPAGVANAN